MKYTSNKLSIFLSYSHSDQEKVRQIRNVLETLNCEPIMFFLKCLDDNNDRLEDFIKAEIQARNLFIYCKSHNSEKSPWVKKELEYIRQFDEKRLYILDIDKGLSDGLIDFLSTLAKILKRNRVFFSHPYNFEGAFACNKIREVLIQNNYQIFSDVNRDSIEIFSDFIKSLEENSNEGLFLAFLTNNAINVIYELGIAHTFKCNIILIALKGTIIPFEICQCQYDVFFVSPEPTAEELEGLLAIIREKKLKSTSRKKKLELIEMMNPNWNDLYYEII